MDVVYVFIYLTSRVCESIIRTCACIHPHEGIMMRSMGWSIGRRRSAKITESEFQFS